MNQRQWLCSASAAMLLLTACSSEPEAETPAPSPAAQAPAAPAAPTAAQKKPANFSQPMVATAQGGAPGLLQSTNPTARLPQVSVGRTDPFAMVPTTPVVIPGKVTPPAGTAAGRVPKMPPVPEAQDKPKTGTPLPAISTTSVPNLSPGAASAPVNGLTVPAAPVKPALPESPTSIASAVEVSGILEASGRVSAIVKVPNETSSRYVSAGDSLADGKVRVKRIEMRSGGEPVVILEQGGIEVVRPVGSDRTIASR